MVHVRELGLYKPALSSGILTLCYQIDQSCKEGENSMFKWVSGSIFFVKDLLYEDACSSRYPKVQ